MEAMKDAQEHYRSIPKLQTPSKPNLAMTAVLWLYGFDGYLSIAGCQIIGGVDTIQSWVFSSFAGMIVWVVIINFKDLAHIASGEVRSELAPILKTTALPILLLIAVLFDMVSSYQALTEGIHKTSMWQTIFYTLFSLLITSCGIAYSAVKHKYHTQAFVIFDKAEG